MINDGFKGREDLRTFYAGFKAAIEPLLGDNLTELELLQRANLYLSNDVAFTALMVIAHEALDSRLEFLQRHL